MKEEHTSFIMRAKRLNNSTGGVAPALGNESVLETQPPPRAGRGLAGMFGIQRLSPKQRFSILLLGLLVITSGTATYFYRQYSVLKHNPRALEEKEVKHLVAKVSQLIVLPENEEPTVATVSDPERLKEQPFFAKAKKGDKVLIYSTARKAILYDPAAHKIVEVAPLNIGNNN